MSLARSPFFRHELLRACAAPTGRPPPLPALYRLSTGSLTTLSLSLSLSVCVSLPLSLSPPLSRQAASLLFSTPPTATHEQALAHFKRAEALAPGQWKENALLIARACGKTHRRAQQQQWARRALAVPSRTAEDRKANREAETLLRSPGGEAPAGSEEQAVRSGEGEE